MIWMALLAFTGGMMVAASQVINSRLGSAVGFLRGSFWNHWVGLIFIVNIILILPNVDLTPLTNNAPWHAYIGGLLGVSVVALHSWIIPKLGAALTIALSISGQVLTGTAMDILNSNITSLPFALLGVIFILASVVLPMTQRSN